MNLIFRFLWVLTHAFFRPKLKFFDKSVVTFHVLPSDIDMNLHMTNSRYLSFMDLGRIDLLMRTGVLTQIWKRGWAPVLGASIIRWRRSLWCFQKFEVHTRLLSWDDKWMYVEQKIISDKTLIFQAVLKGLFTSKKGRISMDKVVEYVGDSIQSPPLSKQILLWQEAEDSLRQHSHETAPHEGYHDHDHPSPVKEVRK